MTTPNNRPYSDPNARGVPDTVSPTMLLHANHLNRIWTASNVTPSATGPFVPQTTAAPVQARRINTATLVRPTGQDLTRVRSHLNRLLVNSLKNVLRKMRCTCVGLKNQLKSSIEYMLTTAYSTNSVLEFRMLQYCITFEYMGEEGANQTMQLIGINPGDLVLELSYLRNRPRPSPDTRVIPPAPVVAHRVQPNIIAAANSAAPIRVAVQPQNVGINRFQPYKTAASTAQTNNVGVNANVPTTNEEEWKKSIPEKFKFSSSLSHKFIELACQPMHIVGYRQTAVQINFSLFGARLEKLRKTIKWLAKHEDPDAPTVEGHEAFYSLMLFSGSKYELDRIQPNRALPTSYPFECKYAINSSEFKDVPVARLNGMKFSNPIDMTPYLLNPSKTDINIDYKIRLNFSVNSSDFWFIVGLVYRYPPASAVEVLKRNAAMIQSSEAVKSEYFSKDAEVAAQRTVLGLKDPLVCLNIKTPARGILCDHLSTFDLYCFLLYNYTNYSFQCPVCFSSIYDGGSMDEIFDAKESEDGKVLMTCVPNGTVGLRICQYTTEIITEFTKRNISPDDYSCIIEEDGSWSINKEDENDFDSDEDEDGAIVNSKHHKSRNSSANSSNVINLIDDDDYGIGYSDDDVIDLTLD